MRAATTTQRACAGAPEVAVQPRGNSSTLQSMIKGTEAGRGVPVPDLGGLIAASTAVLESGQELHLLEGGVYITRDGDCKCALVY